jgi:hypothetical protein
MLQLSMKSTSPPVGDYASPMATPARLRRSAAPRSKAAGPSMHSLQISRPELHRRLHLRLHRRRLHRLRLRCLRLRHRRCRRRLHLVALGGHAASRRAAASPSEMTSLPSEIRERAPSPWALCATLTATCWQSAPICRSRLRTPASRV